MRPNCHRVSVNVGTPNAYREVEMKTINAGLMVLFLVGCGGGEDSTMDLSAADAADRTALSAPSASNQADTATDTSTVAQSVDAEVEVDGRKGILASVVQKESSGTISVNGVDRKYRVKGGYRKGGDESYSVSSPANRGDYEILQFGASRGGGNSEKNEYFNLADIRKQGFTPIMVRGTQDKKIEMWYRKNTGQSSFKTANRAKAYTLLVLENDDGKLNINFDKIRVETEYSNMQGCKTRFGNGSCYAVPSAARNRSGFKVLGYFSDDSVELTSVGGGKLVYQDWGFGDGDGMHMILYRRSQTPPEYVTTLNHDSGGRQYVSMMVVFPEK